MNRFKCVSALLIPGIILWASCKDKGATFPDEPQLTHVSTTPNKIHIFDSTSETYILVRFTDGDGDIGTDPDEETRSIFIKDSRDTLPGDSTFSYPFPYIKPNIRPDGGLEGTFSLRLDRAYYNPWDSLHLALGADTMIWSIFVIDDAGNKSNTITSDTIFIDYTP